MERSSTRADDYYQTMKDSMEAVQKADWKLSMGIELKEGDAQEYVAAVDAYVQNAHENITEKGYELNLAVDLVMGGSRNRLVGRQWGHFTRLFWLSWIR